MHDRRLPHEPRSGDRRAQHISSDLVINLASLFLRRHIKLWFISRESSVGAQLWPASAATCHATSDRRRWAPQKQVRGNDDAR
jgi:hypothetical protein